MWGQRASTTNRAWSLPCWFVSAPSLDWNSRFTDTPPSATPFYPRCVGALEGHRRGLDSLRKSSSESCRNAQVRDWWPGLVRRSSVRAISRAISVRGPRGGCWVYQLMRGGAALWGIAPSQTELRSGQAAAADVQQNWKDERHRDPKCLTASGPGCGAHPSCRVLRLFSSAILKP